MNAQIVRNLWINSSSVIAMFSVLVGIAVSIGYAQQSHQVAFSEEFQGRAYIVDVFTKAEKRIPIKIPDTDELCYCPAKRLLAFVGALEHEGDSQIYTYSLATKKLTVLTRRKDMESLMRPVFSIEGKFLYALNYEEGILRYSFDLKRWQGVPVINSKEKNFQMLSFSPSGKKFAIVTEHFKGLLVGNVESNRLVVTKLHLKDWQYTSTPLWESESSLVVVGRADSSCELWRYNLGNGRKQELLECTYSVRDFASISRDKRKVAFVGMGPSADRNAWPDWAIWILDLKTLKVTRLTRKHKDNDPLLFPVWLE